jgi:hypothetical protein
MTSVVGILLSIFVLFAGVAATAVITGEWKWWGRCLANGLLKLAVGAVPYRQRIVRRREWQAEIDYMRRVDRIPGVLLSLGFVIAGLRLRAAVVLSSLALARVRALEGPALTAARILVIFGGNVYASLAAEPSWAAVTERLAAAVFFSLLTVPSAIEYRLLRAGLEGEPSHIASLVASLVFGSLLRCAIATVVLAAAGLGMIVGSWFASQLSGPVGMSVASLSWTTSGVFAVGAVTCWMFVARTRRLWPAR